MQGCRASIRLRTRRPDGSKIIVWRVASNGKRSKGDWLGTGGGDSTAVEGAGGGGIAVRKAGVRHGRTGREVVVSGGGYWREAGGLVDRAGRMLRWIRTYALGSRGVCSGKGRQKKTSKYSHVGCASRSIHSLQQQGGARRRRKCPEGHAISANGAHPQRAAWGVEPKAVVRRVGCAPIGRDNLLKLLDTGGQNCTPNNSQCCNVRCAALSRRARRDDLTVRRREERLRLHAVGGGGVEFQKGGDPFIKAPRCGTDELSADVGAPTTF